MLFLFIAAVSILEVNLSWN